MQYMGGKFLLGPYIVRAMMDNGINKDATIIEPFCGACNVTAQLCKAGFNNIQASDIHPSLILLWQKAIQEELQTFPLDEASYKAWKAAPDSAEKALVGFGASYGGKWFGGMARNYTAGISESRKNHKPLVYIDIAVRSVNKKSAIMRGRVSFQRRSYLDIPETSGCVYYLDKPYANTTKYSTGGFNHDQFWEWVSKRSQDNVLFVSEYEAPIGTCIMDKSSVLYMSSNQDGVRKKQVEKLFMVGGDPLHRFL